MAKILSSIVIALLLVGMFYLYFQEDTEPSALREPAKTTPAAAGNSGNIEAASSVIESSGPVMLRAAPEPVPGKGMGIQLLDLSVLSDDDSFALYIPQEDSVYQGRVAEVRQSQTGKRVVVGMLDDGEGSHRFLFTIGEAQTFGTLYTSKGRYQLEARDGIGRIISGDAINEGLDFSKPDYVIPERMEPPAELLMGEQ